MSDNHDHKLSRLCNAFKNAARPIGYMAALSTVGVLIGVAKAPPVIIIAGTAAFAICGIRSVRSFMRGWDAPVEEKAKKSSEENPQPKI